jgi:hypothetical protein
MADAAMSALHTNGILASRVSFFLNNVNFGFFWVCGRDRRSSDIARPE